MDREALKRGTSVYLVDRVIPMLPRRLSNGICSLNAGEDRLALSCIMTIDPKGNIVDHEIAETVIHVDQRMSYTGVQKILDGRLRGLRQENARLRQEREQRQEKARQAIESMAAQEEQVRQVYPEFRWQREMENPAFGRLVCAGVEPMAAYEVVHREDILRRAMAYSAKRATRQAARSIASVGRRPAENGGRCVGVTGSDPRGLTSRELADIRRRVMEGEKISF